MSTLELTRVKKTYGSVEVIESLDLSVDDKEFIVLVGPSGCGKSTLLRMIAGLEEISGGDLKIDGEMMNEVPADERGLAMVFQSYALYPHMTVADNMAFALKLAGVGKEERKEKVLKAAKILQLEALLDRKPGQLSGGQRQRVAIGRAIVRQPKIFLFDEPLSNLDAALRVEMRIRLAELHRDLDATMVYVTHDQIEAMTMATRIVVMRAGHIEQVGTPLELYDTPANTFVAGFIGSPKMNLLDAQVTEVQTGGATIALKGTSHLVVPNAGALAVGQKVTVGLRPEILGLSEAGTLVGVVDVIERLGSETLVHVDIGDHLLVTLKLEPSVALEIGQQIRFGVVSGTPLLFGEDGNALR